MTLIANQGQKDSKLRGFRGLGSASYWMELCFNRSEALSRSGWKHVISMEFLRSFLRRHFARKPGQGVAKCRLCYHNRVLKWWSHKNEISEIVGFVRIFWKNNIQEAYFSKMSIFGANCLWDVSRLYSENSIQTLLIFFWGRPKKI